ncbi:hypothetical protein SAMN05444411_101754 [Lutibacter oricola]|uniref:Uncharacterized protein n=1 Tax=Lutibacter oricola TaxID=762486 RepID=A0A1H2TN18_9FLAO|nr:hypothetical protein [Lutibacter oricola]SDW45095.1 hypothetical protein SAMN05444411_101754 [Lutibacter oricola]
MKTLTLKIPETATKAINKFALKNYKTYVAHYESRKLKPMSLEDFLQNYS